jgi:hypothetical protein
VRAELDRIAVDKSPPEVLAREHSTRAEQFENDGDIVSAQREREQARLQRRMLRGKGLLSTSIRFRQQFQILQLWQLIAGKEPGYTTYATPRQARQAPPGGKTIHFFCAACAFVFKKSVSASYAKNRIQKFRQRNVPPTRLTPTATTRIHEQGVLVIPAKAGGTA